ncbi:MAG: CBS domain-containing protein [Candidatus Omnitrophica bacterium]|nr:CBS domain-containing protein [Candidatus Omnitrophota bacterium]
MLSKIHAEDIMTENVIVVPADMPVAQVAHLLLRERVSGYPVTDKNGKILGIVTLTDFFMFLDKIAKNREQLPEDLRGQDFAETLAKCKNCPVAQIMTSKLVAITPQTTLQEIVEAIVKWNIHSFPVMKDGKLAGIIGRHDVLNAIFVYG